MYKALVLFMFLLALQAVAPGASARYASIIIDAETGQVLHATNADTRNYPASLTKMMTLYLTFEALKAGRLRLDQRLRVSKRAAGQPASRLGVKAGSTISVRDAILALITKSANDVATVLAEELGGTEWQFARIMTKRARALGMRRTTFRNASGLPNRRQLSTARDMAMLSRAIIRDFPRYYPLFATREFTYSNNTYRNHNRLLVAYSGTDGIKTGYTRASGFNLAASVERDGRRLIGVVFGGRTARSRDRHLMKLLDRTFEKLARREIVIADAAEAAALAGKSGAISQKRRPVVAWATPDKGKSTRAKAGAAGVEWTRPKGGWSIQVGAFYRKAQAQKAVANARTVLAGLAVNVRNAIVPVRGKRGTIYRARLAGLAEGAAKKACRALRRRKVDCLVIAPSPGSKIAIQPSLGARYNG